MDPLIFEFNDNCSIINNEYVKYKDFQVKYSNEYFNHHTSNVFNHSIWTARAVKNLWNKNSNHWLINIVKMINPKYKNLSLLLAFFHDIGKIDGHTHTLVKPTHPEKGYKMIYENFKDATNNIFGCIKYDYSNESYHIHKITGMLAIVSLCHQDIGEIMKGEMSIKEYIQKISNAVSSFKPYRFHILDFKLIVHLILLISFCDVIGARPVKLYSGKSKWLILNIDLNIKSHSKIEKEPWAHYGYDKKGEDLCTQILNSLDEYTNDKLNINKKGLAYDIPREERTIFVNHTTYNIIVGTIPKDTLFYKATNTFLTQKMHKKWNNPSWFASSHTAEGYLTNDYFGGFKYVFQSENDLTLFLLDEPKNILTLYQMILDTPNTNKDKDYIIHLLQYAFGINADNKLQKEIQKNLFENGRRKYENIPKTYNIFSNEYKRKSEHSIDKLIMDLILCPLSNGMNKIDGYMARRLRIDNMNTFHEEIALCKPNENLKIIQLEKIYNKKTKTELNDSEDMLKHILKEPKILDKLIDYKLGGSKKLTKKEKNKQIQKMIGYKVGKKKRGKKIRKHKGINQRTGRLHKGYKYSKQILKNGLKQIVKIN
tara:strand:+ start:1283 stop:3073 length:1791 start_codon:yes stop_codon:yes gene_type:complete